MPRLRRTVLSLVYGIRGSATEAGLALMLAGAATLVVAPFAGVRPAMPR